MQLSRNTMIIGVLGLIVLGAIGYMIFTSDSGSAVSESAPQSEAEAVFTNLTSEIDPLTFDTSILTDPRFKILVDIHTAVIPEAGGRKDPFAPSGGFAAKK